MTVNGKTDEGRCSTVDCCCPISSARTSNLTGTHVGCDTSQCGACVVHIDGVSMKSCTMLAVTLDGESGHHHRRPRHDGEARLHPMQQAFHQNHGLQCGFCTPGMMMSAVDFAERNPSAHRERRAALARGQYLPLHRLSEHRRGRALPAPPRCRRRRETDHDSPYRHRRLDPAQGRQALHHRQGQLRRRHQAPGYDRWACSCARLTRTRCIKAIDTTAARRAARRRRDLHRRRPRRGQGRRYALRAGAITAMSTARR